jgi:hypothetical protein
MTAPTTCRTCGHTPHPRPKRTPPTRPDPRAWVTLLCRRCEQLFRIQGIGMHCPACNGAASRAGIVGGEWIGEVSGS